jgi:ketosteroid isomerase-like protein
VSAGRAAPVLALSEAFRGSDRDALLRPLHPDVEISDPERVGAGPFRGHQAYLTFVRDWMETWEEYEIALEAPVVIGDTVVALVRHHGRARGSGIEVDQPGAHLYRVQEGLIVFFRPYTDRTEALEAAGLQDPDMWQSAIDTLRNGYDAWSRRDFDALATLLDSNDVEFVPVRQSPDMPTFRGRDEAERFWESLLATWETFTFRPLAFEPACDQLLVEVMARAKGRASGIELEEHWAHLYTLRNGEFVRLQAFTSTEEARAALAYPEPR